MNSNTIIRTNKRENPYVMIDKCGLNDERLSWKAKGLLAYLLSKPDDWQIYESDLIKRAKDGRDAVRTALRELEKYGYMSRRQMRSEGGSFGQMEYVIYERPITEELDTDDGKPVDGEKVPLTENPSTGNPLTENPLLLSNDLTKNDLTKMNECMGADPDAVILSTLEQETKKIHIEDTVTLYDFHFEEIYGMLRKNYADRLDPEIIVIACELFTAKSLDQYRAVPKLTVKNPVGWFHDCYADAIHQWKARRYKHKK
jgi:hypothetical protein